MSRLACKPIVIGCAFLFAAMVTARATPAAATVTWDFLETSLTFGVNPGGPPVPGFTPHVAGSLTMSDADFLKGGITYSATRNFPLEPPSYTIVGDTDFSFDVAGPLDSLPIPTNSNNFFETNSISIATTPSGIITGGVTLSNTFDFDNMNISNNFATGLIETDDETLGCPDTQCNFAGVWSLVPEPGSIAVLTTAIGLLGLLGTRVRRRILLGSR